MPTEEYVCKDGDSFMKISLNKFSSDRAKEIADINHLSVQTMLREGQVIIIPTDG